MATTRALRVGSGRLRIWWANLIADRRLLMVPTLAPCRARPDRYPVTVAGAAGIGSTCCWAHQAVNSRQSDRYPRSVFAARAASTYPASDSDKGTPSSRATTSAPVAAPDLAARRGERRRHRGSCRAQPAGPAHAMSPEVAHPRIIPLGGRAQDVVVGVCHASRQS